MRGDTTSDDERKNITNGRERKNNFAGVIHQQGRHLLDSDWNAQTKIINDWQDIAGKDAISSKFAAIPSDCPEGFKVKSAAVSGDNVQITLSPGRAWARGLLVYLDGEGDVTRTARYFSRPIQDPQADVLTVADGVRDAVILEVCREEINAFQMVDLLIEPALGGIDTTQRVLTAAEFRLLRLSPGEDCNNIISKLDDNLFVRGRLTVSLEPTTIIHNDCNCPMTQEGGYLGFEHKLYRIEIATPSLFRWSSVNGGLVGRGVFDSTTNPKRVTIEANLQAIMRSGLDNSFYLEAVEYNQNLGRWEITFGSMASLNQGVIELSGSPIIGQIPATSGSSVFFRIWDGVAKISDYSVDPPAHLADGIHLKFAADGSTVYKESDYWTFSVRAGWDNAQTLIDSEPPFGIRYQRVSLGILKWDGDRNISGSQIEDCREIFKPISDILSFYYAGGDGQEAPPNTQLPFPLHVGCANANNKPVEKVPIKFTVVKGGGKLGSSGESTFSTSTGTDGLAQCLWTLGGEADQQVKAEMLDANGNPIHIPIFFNAKSEFYQGNCTIVARPGDDLNALIENLPRSGGKVCLTYGTFNLKETVKIIEHDNVSIEGTGNSTRVTISGSETAFLFSDCTGIRVSKILAEPLSHSIQDVIDPQTRGTITFLNCRDIKVTDCSISCIRRLIHPRSCITISNEPISPGSKVEVSRCNLRIESMQIGIISVNCSDVAITDNFVEFSTSMRKPMPGINRGSLLKTNRLYRDLVFALAKSHRFITLSQKAKNATDNVSKHMSHGVSLLQSGKIREAALSFKEAITTIDRIQETLTLVTSGDSSLSADIGSRYKKVIQSYSEVSPVLKQAIAQSGNVDAAIATVTAVTSKAAEASNLLSEGISLISEDLKAGAKLELSQARNLVYAAATDDIDPGLFNSEQLKLVQAAREDLTVGYQGITCAGSMGENIRIQNNTIKGMIQGIHVGVSLADPMKETTKIVADISVAANKIDIKVPKWYAKQTHGIFVGNSGIAYVKDNTIAIEKINNLKLGSQIASPVTGIQMFGYHGKMTFVSSNVISNADIGIRFRTIDFLPNHHHSNSLRVISYNIVYGAMNAYDKSGSINESSIKFGDQSNIP